MESITLDQAKAKTAWGIEVYEWGFPKMKYVDIDVQEWDDFMNRIPCKKTFLLIE